MLLTLLKQFFIIFLLGGGGGGAVLKIKKISFHALQRKKINNFLEQLNFQGVHTCRRGGVHVGGGYM